MHITVPPAEPALSPGSCADRSPAAQEQPSLKLQPGRKQEPASAKHQLGARNSPGLSTRHFLGRNFPARGTQSIAAQPCRGQGGRQRKPFFGAILAMGLGEGGRVVKVLFQATRAVQCSWSEAPHLPRFGVPAGCAACTEPAGWFCCPTAPEASVARTCPVPSHASASSTTSGRDRTPWGRGP